MGCALDLFPPFEFVQKLTSMQDNGFVHSPQVLPLSQTSYPSFSSCSHFSTVLYDPTPPSLSFGATGCKYYLIVMIQKAQLILALGTTSTPPHTGLVVSSPKLSMVSASNAHQAKQLCSTCLMAKPASHTPVPSQRRQAVTFSTLTLLPTANTVPTSTPMVTLPLSTLRPVRHGEILVSSASSLFPIGLWSISSSTLCVSEAGALALESSLVRCVAWSCLSRSLSRARRKSSALSSLFSSF